MTCRDVLEALLIADPSELAGVGDTPVARHVRGCARCGAVARRLTSETRVLASAIAAGHRARHGSTTRAGYPLGAVAGSLVLAGLVLFVAVPRQADRGTPNGERATVVVPAPAAAPVPPAASGIQQSAAVAAPVSLPVRGQAATPRRYHAVPFHQPRAVAAVSAVATVAVEPSAGQRAAVIRTANPAVTVVWIY